MLLEIGILILAFPVGYLLAWLARDELVAGRRWFKIIVLISSLSAIISVFFNITIALTLAFISIVTIISLIKSYDKKFVK